jgi:large subunit ribosomal protein L24
MHVKTGDKVQVMSGRDRGQTGTVLRIDSGSGRVIVESVNMVKRHQRPGPNGAEGGIIEKEAFLDASNVLIYSEKLEKGVRTRSVYVGQNGEQFDSRSAASASFGDVPGKVSKVRLCVKTGEVFE